MFTVAVFLTILVYIVKSIDNVFNGTFQYVYTHASHLGIIVMQHNDANDWSNVHNASFACYHSTKKPDVNRATHMHE